MNDTVTIQEFHAWLKAEQEESELQTALRDLIQLADAEKIRKILGRERALQGWSSWR